MDGMRTVRCFAQDPGLLDANLTIIRLKNFQTHQHTQPKTTTKQIETTKIKWKQKQNAPGCAAATTPGTASCHLLPAPKFQPLLTKNLKNRFGSGLFVVQMIM